MTATVSVPPASKSFQENAQDVESKFGGVKYTTSIGSDPSQKQVGIVNDALELAGVTTLPDKLSLSVDDGDRTKHQWTAADPDRTVSVNYNGEKVESLKLVEEGKPDVYVGFHDNGQTPKFIYSETEEGVIKYQEYNDQGELQFTYTGKDGVGEYVFENVQEGGFDRVVIGEGGVRTFYNGDQPVHVTLGADNQLYNPIGSESQTDLSGDDVTKLQNTLKSTSAFQDAGDIDVADGAIVAASVFAGLAVAAGVSKL